MSELKISPGTWTAAENADGFCVKSDHEHQSSAGGTYRLYVAQFMTEPDAKFCAASPTMYEALEFFANEIGIGSDPDYRPMIHLPREKILAARAALSLARGETK